MIYKQTKEYIYKHNISILTKYKSDNIVSIYIIILLMNSKQLKVANQKFTLHQLFLCLML
jgi:hypothetical protein